MAIDCHEGQSPASTKAPVHSHKLIKSLEPVEKIKVEGIPEVLLQNKDGHWAKLLLQGTATETKESSALGISIIAQPECENNQEICPTSPEGPLYITNSKQYSFTESHEHIPNNVANATEGKLAQPPRFPKSKKKRRKRSAKNNSAKSARRSQTTPEQETRTPIPVQDEDSQSEQWPTNNIQNYFPSQQSDKNIQYSPSTSQPYTDDQKALNKLISPSQFICHVAVGKLQPSTNLPGALQPGDGFSKYITASGPDGYKEKYTSPWGSSKFTDFCKDLKSQSVEDGVLYALKDSVSYGEPQNLCTLAKSWKKSDDDDEHVDNEGVLLNEKLKMIDYEYKDGIHWTKGKELGRGGYGDVHLGTDNTTGLTFAAKTINMNRFRAEELTCHLAVNSEKIIPVYGAVREGPWITVFMQPMDGGSLGQLIKRSGFLAEDRALHYVGQVLQGLKHLHAANILHGDIKADNVLLSNNGETAYLCDFGHAASLHPGGSKTQLLTGDYVPGTETHMAPEVVRGEPCDTKLDVWSACCMLLHMLNGWHPWSRTHKAPLWVKIAAEPPPLQEIPPSCNNVTRGLIVDGLQKDPRIRADAMDLIQKVDIALRKIGGLKSSYNTEYREPRIFPPPFTESPQVPGSQLKTFPEGALAVQGYSKQHITEEASFTSHKSEEQAGILYTAEIERLELDLLMDNLSQPLSLKEHEQMFLSEPSLEPQHSRKDSITTWDTKSSGIHSWDSRVDPWSLQSDPFFSGGITTTPSWFNGVKVQLKSFSGEILYIWESGRTKLGDLAVGISSQIPIKSFTIVNSKGTNIPWDTDITDCGIELQCALAPDRERWAWRVKKGKIEEGNTGEVYTGGGTDTPE